MRIAERIRAVMTSRLMVIRRMGLVAFNVVLFVAKKTVLSLQDSVGLVPVTELPVHVD